MVRPATPLLLAFALLAACGDKDPPDDTAADDTAAADDTEAPPVDADGDGFDVTEDCDDDDPAIFPGAAEACDGVDQDCDGAIDEDATDRAVYYVDADGDGYGEPSAAVESCPGVAGLVEDASDCDDGDPEVHPGAVEVGCDRLDNDCDGSVDLNRVPTDFETLQAAVDGLPDGAEVCVEAGTWTERLDLSGRTLRFTGQEGVWQTVLDVGADAPMITIEGASQTFEAGDVTFSGFSITGGEVVADGALVQGGFARVVGGTLTLSDVVVDDLSGAMMNGGVLEGLLVWAEDSSLHLHDVDVQGVDLSLRGASSGHERLDGGLLRTISGELDIASVAVSGLSLSGDVGRERCYAYGVVLAADDNGYLGQADTRNLVGTTLAISDLELRDNTLTLHCAQDASPGALLYFENTPGELSGLTASGNVVDVVVAGRGHSGNLARFWMPSAQASASLLDFSDNVIDVTGVTGASGALFHGPGLDFSTLNVHGNRISTHGGPRGWSEALVSVGAGVLDHLDMRGNTVSGAGYTVSLVVVEARGREAELSNFIIAGNTLRAGEGSDGLFGGAIELYGDDRSVTARNGDIVGNRFSGAVWSWTAALTAFPDATALEVNVRNVQIVDNVHEEGEPFPALYPCTECSGVTHVAYSNLYGQSAQTPDGDLSGADGNISADPLYTDTSGADPATWDLRLQQGSPAMDAGDPSVSDDDGSRSDMGAYGGPGGSTW